MKKAVVLVLLAGSVMFAYGCRKDVFVEPPASLSGDYQGIYIYKFEGQSEETQLITWRFTSAGYTMRFDEESGDVRKFCDNVGVFEYEASGIVMETTLDNLTEQLCAPQKNPAGAFSVFNPTDENNNGTLDDDTLRLVQVDGELTVTIKLVKDFEE